LAAIFAVFGYGPDLSSASFDLSEVVTADVTLPMIRSKGVGDACISRAKQGLAVVRCRCVVDRRFGRAGRVVDVGPMAGTS
jgi:hypothetical protein